MGKIKNIIVAVLVALLVSSIFLNAHYHNMISNWSNADTTFVTFIDTIHYFMPTPVEEVAVSKATVKLPTAPSVANEDEYTSIELKSDSVEVVVPITQKVYKDSTYTAYVSGFNPNLDSLFIYPRHDVITITKTIRPKQKRWSVGIQAGYGITLKRQPELSPYIGIGISYNLFSF